MSLQGNIEVIVNTMFVINLDGNAHITDRKIVKNLSEHEQRLKGPFRQSIRNDTMNIQGRDSDGRSLECHRNPDMDTQEIVLRFAPSNQEFVIPAKTTKWFEIEYDASQFANRVEGGLLFMTRTGNLKYDTTSFNHFSYNHTYIFNLQKPIFKFKRLLNTYELQPFGFNPTIEREKNAIIVSTSGTLIKKESHINVILLSAKYRKSLAALLAAILGSGITKLIDFILNWAS
ncbi:MAG: hypothetical protein KAW14_03565 [Candidatus Aegiribacteria sp.]|nr:hypothetical protein [Candidatus Aegiribacteria sp.]